MTGAGPARTEVDGMESARRNGPLLSIHLTSNRPKQFVDFLDRLQATTVDVSAVEVVVKIDEHDRDMNLLLQEECVSRPFRIRYISSPLEGGFYSLWQCYDDLLKACDPDAYFVVGLNDEMGFSKRGWDKVLETYVGMFPDHIYRLRTSAHRWRNYYDYWEAGFANDTSAIMTKRWLDIGGGWCPCNGPDTFQQSVAFYFGWLDRFNASRPYREIPIHDIELVGHGAAHGLTGSALRRRQGGSLAPYFVLMSHAKQEEAARRARKLLAHIWLHENGEDLYEIQDNRRRKRIELVDRSNGAVIRYMNYQLNRSRILFTNFYRMLNFGYYCAGGESNSIPWYRNFLIHLCLRIESLDSYFEIYEQPPEKQRLVHHGYFFGRALIRAAWNRLAHWIPRLGR